MNKRLLQLADQLVDADLKKIEALYGTKVGLGLFEKCNDALSVLKLLHEKGCLDTEADLQIMLDGIGKPTLLKDIPAFRLNIVKTCGKSILLQAPCDMGTVDEVQIADANYPLDWCNLNINKDFTVERNTYLKLLPRINHVKEKGVYNLKVKITMVDGEKSEFFFNKLSVQADADCGYIKYHDDFWILAHNNGVSKNVHFYEDYQKITPTTECNNILRGATKIAKTADSFKALAWDLFKDNKYAWRFPPAYDINDGLVKDVCDAFEKALPKGTRIFTGYDCVKHIKMFKIDTDAIFEACDDDVECDNVVVLVNDKAGIFCVFKVTAASSEIELTKELKQCNVILKSIMTMFTKELKYAFLFGGLVVSQLERRAMKEENIFCLNGDFSSVINDGLIFLTKDDLTSTDTVKSWWRRLRKKVKDERKQKLGKSPNCTNNFEVISSQILATMSLVSESLRITKSSQDRVASLLLNKEQLDIVYEKEPLKVVQGPFGSGKSLILKALALKIFRGCLNHEASIIYVCWDPYSLIEAEVNYYFQELVNKFPAKAAANVTLYCANLKELAEENGFELEDLLKSVGNKRETFGRFLRIFLNSEQQLHLLIDEFPGVAVDEEVCQEIKKYKKSSCKGSTLVIACQSTEKNYEIHSKQKVFKISKKRLVRDAGMKSYTLSKSMRMCCNLFELVKVAQKQVTSSMLPIVAEKHVPITRRISCCEKDCTGDNGGDQVGNRLAETSSQEEDEFSSNDNGSSGGDSSLGFGSFEFTSATYMDTLPIDSSGGSTPVKRDVSKLHEPEALLKEFSSLSRDSSKSLKTRYEYHRGSSGHSICSEINPNLIYLPNEFQLDTAESVKILQYLLRRFCITDDDDEGGSSCQTTIICNDIEELRMVRFALRWMDEDFVEYTAYLRGHYPELEEKLRVFKKLHEEASILVTDYRGFRGCEAEHCVCFINQKDLYGDHILIEILTRAISRLDLIVYSQEAVTVGEVAVSLGDSVMTGGHGGHGEIPCSKVLDAWKKHPQELVTVHSVASMEFDIKSEWISFQINGEDASIELCQAHSREYRERKASIESEIKSPLEEGIQHFQNTAEEIMRANQGTSSDFDDAATSFVADKSGLSMEVDFEYAERKSEDPLELPINKKAKKTSFVQRFEYEFLITKRKATEDVKIFLPDKVEMFSNREPLDKLSHVVTFTDALKIVKCGFHPEPFKGLSVINKQDQTRSNQIKHDLYGQPLFALQTSVISSNCGNVAFSAGDIDLSKFNVYLIDFVECANTKTVHLLLTRTNYENMYPVDLDNEFSPIFKVDGEFFYNTEFNAKHTSIEVLTDEDFKCTHVSYVSVNNMVEKITIHNDKVDIMDPYVFTESTLGYLFYCLLKHEAALLRRNFVFAKDEKRHETLLKALLPVQDLSLVPLSTFSPDRVKEANKVMRQLQIPRAFWFRVNRDSDDIETFRNLERLFEESGGCYPSPSECIRRILEILCRYIEEGTEQRCKGAGNVIQVFLNNFCREESSLLARAIYEFCRDVWK